MRFSRLALLSTFSVLAVLTATAAQAATPPTLELGFLKPQDKWKIGTVNTPGAPYCAMVNQFDRDIALAFARSVNGLGSVAIDFYGKFFKPGQEYGVSMQADGGEMYKFVGRASSERSVVVQVGVNDGFYNSLSGDGSLQVSLPTVDMKFSLNKFSSSYTSLVDCATKLRQPHQGPKTVAMPVPAVEKTSLADSSLRKKGDSLTAQEKIGSVTQLQEQLEVMRKFADERKAVVEENAALKEENASLSPGKSKAENDLAAARENLSELGNLLISVKKQKEELASNVELRDKETKDLQIALAAREQELTLTKAVSAESSRMLNNARDEIARLKIDHVAALERLQGQLKDKVAQNDDLQKRLGEQTRKMAAEQLVWQQKVAGFEKQFADVGMQHKYAVEDSEKVQSELAQHRQRLADMRVQMTTAEQQKEDLLQQDKQNRTLIGQLQGQLDQYRQKTAMLESQMVSVAVQKDDISARLASKTQQNKILKSTLSDQGADMASLQEDDAPGLSAQERSRDLAAIAPAAGDIGGYAAPPPRRKSFLPSTSSRTLQKRNTKAARLKLRVPTTPAARDSYAASDDWETVVVQ